MRSIAPRDAVQRPTHRGVGMALIGLSEAARVTGKNRTTIFRAMKSGRLSFTMNGAGERQVDIAELERVFPATSAVQPESDNAHTEVLRVQLEAERRANALLERTNDDLRRRLDASEEERRRVHAQLTALLSDRRDPSVPEPSQTAPWPRRVLTWLARQHM
jgi:hypothetical protein